MIIFKSYMRVIRKIKAALALPLGIFMIFLIIIYFSAQQKSEEFMIAQPEISIINEGEETPLVAGLKTYLRPYVTFVDLKDDALEDALFYRDVYFAMVIPEGYTAEFINGAPPELITYASADSQAGYLVEQHVNTYLHYYEVYHEAGYTHDAIMIRLAEAQLQRISTQTLQAETSSSSQILSTFLNLETYPLTLAVLSIITNSLMMFQQTAVKSRAAVSATSPRRQNLQLALGVVLVGHILWFMMKSVSTLFLRNTIDWSVYGYMILNSYLFFLSILSLAFLLSNVVKTHSKQVAICNTTALGLAFISGSYVPREFIGPVILNIAKCFPYYWNIEVNTILSHASFSWQDLLVPWTIQIGFAVIYFLISLILSRQRSFKDLNAKQAGAL